MISERLALFDDFLAESGLTLSIDVFFEFNADVYISTSWETLLIGLLLIDDSDSEIDGLSFGVDSDSEINGFSFEVD